MRHFNSLADVVKDVYLYGANWDDETRERVRELLAEAGVKV